MTHEPPRSQLRIGKLMIAIAIIAVALAVSAQQPAWVEGALFWGACLLGALFGAKGKAGRPPAIIDYAWSFFATIFMVFFLLMVAILGFFLTCWVVVSCWAIVSRDPSSASSRWEAMVAIGGVGAVAAPVGMLVLLWKVRKGVKMTKSPSRSRDLQ